MKKISIVSINKKLHNKKLYTRISYSIYDLETSYYEILGKTFEGAVARETAPKLIARLYPDEDIQI